MLRQHACPPSSHSFPSTAQLLWLTKKRCNVLCCAVLCGFLCCTSGWVSTTTVCERLPLCFAADKVLEQVAKSDGIQTLVDALRRHAPAGRRMSDDVPSESMMECGLTLLAGLSGLDTPGPREPVSQSQRHP